jgi:serine/threonine protein kinase
MVNPLTQEVKLIDFGFAKHLGKQQNTGYMVTRWYRPLEIVLGLEYDEKIDVFGAGAVFLELICGREIFPSSSNTDHLYLLLNICGYPQTQSKEHAALTKMGITNVYDSPQLAFLTKNISDLTREVITAMLSNSSQNRPPIQRLLQHLTVAPMASVPRSQRESLLQPRRRANSAAQGLTLVSLQFSSRSRSNSKA